MALIPPRDTSLPWLRKVSGSVVYVSSDNYYYIPRVMEPQRGSNLDIADKSKQSSTTNSIVVQMETKPQPNKQDPFSEIAQRMVDEQLSGCQSFKSKIEESLQELHQQWNRRNGDTQSHNDAVMKNEVGSPHALRSQPCLIMPRSPIKNLMPRKHILYDEGLDHRIDPDRNSVIVAHHMLSSSTHNYVPLRPTEATKTCILKPTLVNNDVYNDWKRSSVICKTSPHRVPAKRLSCTDTDIMQSTPRVTIPSFDRHSVKLEGLRDGNRSAFSSYSNHYGEAVSSPLSPSTHTEDRHSCSPHSDTSGEHIVRVKTEPGIYEPVNVHYNGGIVQCANIDSSEGVSRLLGLARVANEHLGIIQATPPKVQKRRTKGKGNDCLHLWEFLRDLLNQNDQQVECIEWTCRERGEFRLIKTAVVAKLWGKSKNRHQMTYEKMARAMRYYYKMNILEKVPNKRLHFRFGNHMLPKVICE